ncbi:MAG: hypothetical protein EA361_10445 [Bacteroidetes bacterium]|nr:MAG: hypothetical protein EA361_10445 [Bacteroidota bacterium]
MKAKILFVAVLLFSSALLAAQSSDSSDSGLLSGDYSVLNSQPDFGMQFGTSFTSGFGGGSLFSQSFAPHMKFRPGQNFSLVVGSVFSTGSFGGSSPFGFQGEAGTPDRMYSTTVYALGAYQVNSRLVITGGAWAERNNMDMMFAPAMNPQAFDINPRGMMMGMEYKITENLRFGAEINVSQGYTPFNPYMQQRSFQSSPFHRRNPW